MKKILAVLLSVIAISLSAQDARYEIKSAIIKTKTVGTGTERIIYIDDYGKKESLEMTQVIGGIENRIRIIYEDIYSTTVNLDSKQGSKILALRLVNFLHLTPEVIEKYKLKEAGEEEFLGKVCKIYYEERTTIGGLTMRAKSWVWKGIVLKSESSYDGGTSSTIATEIKENVVIPSEKFTVPKDVNISDKTPPISSNRAPIIINR